MRENKKFDFLLKIKLLLKSKYFWIALLVLLFAIIATFFACYYLQETYGRSLPVLNDLLMDNLPYLKVAWLYDLIAILLDVSFAIYAFRKKFNNFAYFMLLIGLFHLIRSIFIILTPLGVPNGGGKGLSTDLTALQGEFPSGHIGDAFLMFLFSNGKMKKICLLSVFAMIILLLLGRGHYSIDMFAAIIFSYAIYCFGEKYLKEKFRIK
jgi:hypothetical protein